MIYWFPNRPTLIPPDRTYIEHLEVSGHYIAEQKWNGDNVLVYTDGMEFWNRQKERHRFVPDQPMLDELKKWPKHSVLNAELMHYHTKDIKNILIVHCVMVWKGKTLLGKTWGDSRKILEQMPSGKYVQISRTYDKDFWNLYQAADGNTIEGIILKRPDKKLVFSATPITDVNYMYKVRKPCKKYQF